MTEHDFEPVPGLPAVLPSGETLLWQGAPRWQALARHAFRIRFVGGYFLVLAGWRIFDAARADAPVWEALRAGLPALSMGALAVGLLGLLAWLNARATLYTITSRRIVMRFGVAIPVSVNLPFAQIESVDLRSHDDGSGDLTLSLIPPARVSYTVFWPHVRPWHLAVPKPTLRAIAEPQELASRLRLALEAAPTPPVPAGPMSPAWASVP